MHLSFPDDIYFSVFQHLGNTSLEKTNSVATESGNLRHLCYYSDMSRSLITPPCFTGIIRLSCAVPRLVG